MSRAAGTSGLSDAPQRVTALVRGRVQGVGFRVATARRAHALCVSGWVRNLHDGRVEVAAEGASAAVEAMLDFLAEGPRGALVERVDSRSEPVRGESGFEILPDVERT